MAVKKSKNNDAKSVASKESWEISYICSVFKDVDGRHLKSSVLKSVMANLGKNGKPSRSRRNIYVGLIAMGYVYFPKKK